MNREFDEAELNTSRVKDITSIRTNEGWLCLGVIIDLFSPKIARWPMIDIINTDLVLMHLLWPSSDASLMAM